MKRIMTHSFFLFSIFTLSGCIVRINTDDLFEGCLTDAVCGGDYFCADQACTFYCDNANDIDRCETEGGLCVTFGNEAPRCVQTCEFDTDCTFDNYCNGLTTDTTLDVCTPMGFDGSRARADWYTTNGGIFEYCEASLDCEQGLSCINNTCTYLCEDPEEIQLCEDEAGVCAAFTEEPQHCVFICGNDVDCSYPNVCAESLVDSPGLDVCTPTE